MPDPDWDPKMNSSNLDNMDVLGQEGESFLTDGTIRVNTRANYKEALLPLPLTAEGMETSQSNLVLLPNGEMMCVWTCRKRATREKPGAHFRVYLFF